MTKKPKSKFKTRWLTATEAADYAGRSRQAVYNATVAGKLRSAQIRDCRGPRYLREWIDAWPRKQKTPAQKSAAARRRKSPAKIPFDQPQFQPLGSEALYVLELGVDRIKVGRSVHPERRVATHRAHARGLGVSTGRHWIGPSGWGPRETELITWCAARATGRPIAEVFIGVPYEDAVEFADRVLCAQGVDAASTTEQTNNESGAAVA